jgi:hypothetical protein
MYDSRGTGDYQLNLYPANVENMVSSNNDSKWQMGFNSAFKGLRRRKLLQEEVEHNRLTQAVRWVTCY